MPIVAVPPPGLADVEGWTNQYRTMSQLLADLRVALRSPASAGAGERNKWTDTELYHCLRRACMELSPMVLVPDALTFEMDGTSQDYQLPAFVKRIGRVRVRGYQQLISVESGLSTRQEWRDIQGWEYMTHPLGNTLRFKELYHELTDCEVLYLRTLQVPPVPSALVGAHNGAITEISVANPSDFPAPGIVRIDTELIWYQKVSPGALSYCVRGVFDTAAGSHLDTAAVDPVVMIEAGAGLSAVLLGGELYAHRLRMNDHGQSSLSQVITQVQQAEARFTIARKALQQPLPVSQAPNTQTHRPVMRVVIR